MAEADLPSAESMLSYLEETRAMTMAWIDTCAEEGLDRRTDGEEWIRLEQIVYALRHLQHHSGEVCAYQKQFNHDQNQWT
jgi:hypothetical protein